VHCVANGATGATVAISGDGEITITAGNDADLALVNEHQA
jgi:hypothetical protein